MQKVLDAITADEVDAYYLHLAEGMRDNERSQKEFAHLVEPRGAHLLDGDHPRDSHDPRGVR